jgi:hypothetical protein
MEPESSKPTLILKVGGKIIKEYTRGRIVQRLRQGKLSTDTLIHNPDGFWRKISETPGFRTLCSQFSRGQGKTGAMPVPQAGGIPGEAKPSPSLPPETCSAESEESIGFRDDLDGAGNLSREEFIIESEDDDSSGESPDGDNPGEGSELETDDSGESPQPFAGGEAGMAVSDSSDEVAGTSKGPADRSESVNPYAGRQYFRVKPKGAKKELAYEENEPDAEKVWKKRLILGVLALWGLGTVYWLLAYTGETGTEPRSNLEGQPPLVSPQDEKKFFENGNRPDVPPADKKAIEDLKASFMKSKGK